MKKCFSLLKVNNDGTQSNTLNNTIEVNTQCPSKTNSSLIKLVGHSIDKDNNDIGITYRDKQENE